MSKLKEAERHLICSELENCQGNQSMAARNLQIAKQSLHAKIKSHRIDVNVYRRPSVKTPTNPACPTRRDTEPLPRGRSACVII
jgi:hypothetical protein